MDKNETTDLGPKVDAQAAQEQVNIMSFLTSRIHPDPVKARNCRIQGCWGKRGWHSISASADDKGKPVYSVVVCCGRVGDTEHSQVITAIQNVQKLAEEIKEIGLATGTGVGVIGPRVKTLHERFTTPWYKRLMAKVRSARTNADVVFHQGIRP